MKQLSPLESTQLVDSIKNQSFNHIIYAVVKGAIHSLGKKEELTDKVIHTIVENKLTQRIEHKKKYS